MLLKYGFAAFFYWTGLTLGADTLIIPAKYLARDLGRSWILCNAPLDTWTPSERLTASHLLVGNEVLTLASLGLPELGKLLR
jgi:hypothetical protein